MNKIPRFDKLLKGLEILNDYRPEWTELNPIPSSFSNGSPNHSMSAYLAISLENWPVNDVDKNKLENFGWKEEQEGVWWVFQ